MKWLLLPLVLLALPFADAYLSSDIYLGNDGSATFIGRASSQLNIKGIEFDNGKVYGETQELTSKNGTVWTFFISLIDAGELNIFLPENAELKVSTLASNLAPEVADYRNLILITLSGENPQISFDYEISEKKETPIAIYLSAGIIALLVIIIPIFYARKIKKIKNRKTEPVKRHKIKKRIDIVRETLNEREREIINRLLALKKARQSFLQKKTGIPKASFSRHIKNLEGKGIIERIGQGKNNILRIRREMLARA